MITAVAVTEPDAGSDVKGIRTRARRDGDDYVLNGAKMFITNGVHADLYCVAAKTGAEGERPSRSVYDVPRREGHAGLPRRPRARQARLALVRHGRARLRGLPRSRPRTSSARRGQGFYAIMRNFQNERLVIGAMAMGEAQAAIDDHARLA